MHSLWMAIIHTSGAKIYSALVGILALFITARFLGPEGRGKVAVILTWVSMFSVFSGLSIGQVVIHYMSNSRKGMSFNVLFTSLLRIAIFLTIIGWIFAGFIYVRYASDLFNGISLLTFLLGFLALPFMLWEQYSSSLLMGIDHLKVYNFYQIVGKSIYIFGVIVLLYFFGLGVNGALFSNVIGQIVTSCGGILLLLRHSPIKTYKNYSLPIVKPILKIIKDGMKLHLNAIGNFLFTSVNILIINSYTGAREAGYFQLSTQLIGIMMIFPQAVCAVMYSRVANKGLKESWPENRALLMQTLALMILFSIIAASFAPFLIVFFAGEAFEPSVKPFQIMLFGIVGATMSALMAPQWIGRGYFITSSILTFIIGVANLGAAFILVPSLGIMGAVYAFVFTYVIAIFGNGGMYIHCNRIYKKSVN